MFLILNYPCAGIYVVSNKDDDAVFISDDSARYIYISKSKLRYTILYTRERERERIPERAPARIHTPYNEAKLVFSVLEPIMPIDDLTPHTGV